MKKRITEEDIINWWMVPCFGITIEKAYETEPWTDSRDFYRRYQVTQEQHDEWYETAITNLMKHYKRSRRWIKRDSTFIYLNTRPMVKLPAAKDK